MKNNRTKSAELICAATSIFMSTAIQAGIPPIDITLSSGPGSNYVSLIPGQTAIAEYRIQDVIGRPPSRTWLWASAIAPYITRAPSIQQPDCAVYNQPSSNPNSFTLPPNGFCYFAFQIDGTAFAASQIPNTTYRPIFSNSDAIAYGPCETDSLNISLSSTPLNLLIAGGNYFSDIIRPLLVVSQNSGATWTYPSSIPAVPASIPYDDLGLINGTSCVGNICIAVGSVSAGGDSDSGFRPTLAVTQNAGTTWIYNEDASFPNFVPNNSFPFSNYGEFLAASCSSSICIAVGDYAGAGDEIRRPLLIQSQNSGTTWSYPDSITNPQFTPLNQNPFSSDGYLFSASCSGNLCTAVGNYRDNDDTIRPLLVQSQNAGLSWNFPESITSPDVIPAFVAAGSLAGTSCYGSLCTTVGGYDSDIFLTRRPLLAVSTNSGITWNYISNPITTPNVTPAFSTGAFRNTSCYGNRCVAVGYYNDNAAVIRPLLAVSNDSGSTWSFSQDVSSPVFVPNDNPFESGSFYGISCNASVCVAVGVYSTPLNGERPLLAISRDEGATWNFSASVTQPLFTPSTTYPLSSGAFYQVSCNEITCLATGRYTDTNEAARPLLAFTNDFGTSWIFPDSVVNPVFVPTNQYPYNLSGGFTTATASTSAYIPNKLKFIYQKNVKS